MDDTQYYCLEMDQNYLSFSSVKALETCQAAHMAKLYDGYEKPDQNAEHFLVGKLTEALVTDQAEFDRLLDEHKDEIVSSRGATKGQLKSAFKSVYEFADALKKQAAIMELLDTNNQPVFLFEFAGYPFKAKLDAYQPGSHIADLKTTKDDITGLVWCQEVGCKLPWWQKNRYELQAALYQEAVRQKTGELLPYFIVGVQKQTDGAPNVDIVEVPQDLMDRTLESLEHSLDIIGPVWMREEEPQRCNFCHYCRSTKVLESVLDKEVRCA